MRGRQKGNFATMKKQVRRMNEASVQCIYMPTVFLCMHTLWVAAQPYPREPSTIYRNKRLK